MSASALVYNPEMASHRNSSMGPEFHLSDAELVVLASLNILFSIVGTLGNVFVCFAFMTYPKLRNSMKIFILSLACSDLLVCLVAQPMFVISLVKRYQQTLVSNVFEDVRKVLTWISLLASAGNLLGVTADRYVAIINPLRYGDYHEIKPAAGVFVTVIWFFAVSLGTSTGYSSTSKIIGQIYVFLVVFCLILPIYSRVFYIARHHRQRIMASAQACDVSLNSDGQPLSPTSRQRRLQKRFKADKNGIKTVGVICAVFVLGWFPLLVVPFVYRSTTSRRRELVLDLFQWVNTLALCSSAANPIVYSWTNRRFRESLQMVHKRWTARRSALDSSPKTPKMGKPREFSSGSSSRG